MAGDKNSYTLDLNPDHMDFLTATKDKYRIPDESKVVRIAFGLSVPQRGHPRHRLCRAPVPPLRRVAGPALQRMD